MLDLEPIKARMAAALQGRWMLIEQKAIGLMIQDTKSGSASLVLESCHLSNWMVRDTMNLVANAPTDLAALVAEVERLRGELAFEVQTTEKAGEILDRLRAELRVEKAQRLTDAHMFSRQVQEANAEHAWILDAVRCHRREARAVNLLVEPAQADARLWGEVLGDA
jgi:hypothetical protein